MVGEDERTGAKKRDLGSSQYTRNARTRPGRRLRRSVEPAEGKPQHEHACRSSHDTGHPVAICQVGKDARSQADGQHAEAGTHPPETPHVQPHNEDADDCEDQETFPTEWEVRLIFDQPTASLTDEPMNESCTRLEEMSATQAQPEPRWTEFKSAAASAVKGYLAPFGLPFVEEEPKGREHFRIVAEPIPFPDGVGRGILTVTGYVGLSSRNESLLHLEMRLDHNRVFRGTSRPLFLNSCLSVRQFPLDAVPSSGDYKSGLRYVDAARTHITRSNQERARRGSSLQFLKLAASAPSDG